MGGFEESLVTRIACAAVGRAETTDPQRRALRSCQLLSQASLSGDPATRTVLSMPAAEVLLIERRDPTRRGRQPKTWTVLLAVLAGLCALLAAQQARARL